MRSIGASALLILLSGLFLCVQAEELVPTTGLAPSPLPSVSASLQLPPAYGSYVAPVPLSLPELLGTAKPVAPSESCALPGNDPNADESGEGEFTPVNGEQLDEESAEASLDPETLEETKVLTDESAAPPDDEGVTVQTKEVVFDFPVVENQKVQYFIDYYTGSERKVFGRWLERATRYIPYIQETFAAHGLPRDLAYLAIVESGLNPKAYSWAHASGPWQFIRGTGKIFDLESDYWIDERRDFEKSTVAAARYLKELYNIFDGDWYLAVAAYNAGDGKVMRATRCVGSRDFWVLSRTRYLKEETKNYIPKLLAVLMIAKQPEKYGFTDLQPQPPFEFDTVTLASPTDLEVVARLTDSNYEQIKSLNPELKRWCSPPKVENYVLKVPVGTKELFQTAYNELPEAERVNYKYHKVAKGETLKGLSKLYKISVAEILAVNSIPPNTKTIKTGKSLAVPLRKGVTPIPAEDLLDDPVQVKVAGKTYKVHQGDTLGKIAKRSGLSVKKLMAWNGLGPKSTLRIGQVLALGPWKVKKPQTAKAKPVAAKVEKLVYKVREGDTLSDIAHKYEVSAAQIRTWNELPKSYVLQPGDRLKLRVSGRRGG